VGGDGAVEALLDEDLVALFGGELGGGIRSVSIVESVSKVIYDMTAKAINAP
jgi:hypothetical protein